jgi:hypothetical protein
MITQHLAAWAPAKSCVITTAPFRAGNFADFGR